MRLESLPSRSPRLRPLTAAALVLVLAACASHPPAPIVQRTTPSGTPRPAEPPPGAGQPAPPAATVPAVPPPPEAPVVQTAPVRPGAVESRGIESRPLEPGTAGQLPVPGQPPLPGQPPVPGLPPGAGLPQSAAGLPPVPSAPALPPNTRTVPRGTKTPFSDATLAELRAAESAPRAADPKPAEPAPAAAAPPAAAAAPPAAAAAAAGPASADDEWMWPATGRVMQGFSASNNKGLVIAGRIGDPIVAVADGRVIFSGNGPRGYGNLVIVKHSNELLSVYAHNRTLAVKEGQNVRRGQKIAELGDSGTSSPRLHFEIRQQGKPIDPATVLPRR